jgi:glutamate racemase
MKPTRAGGDSPLGVFDSGIGGLTVFRQLVRILPEERLLYFGDTARVPYGTKSGETVVRFTLEAARFLGDQGVKALVVACNTASAYALEAVEEELGIPVVGVIESGARAAIQETRKRRIGVIGTTATITSGAYDRALKRLAPDLTLVSKACPLFVPLVEEGWTEHPVTRMVAEEYLAPLSATGVDALILGCTHYPLLKYLLRQVMGADVALIDAGEFTARAVGERLGEAGLRARTRSAHTRAEATDPAVLEARDDRIFLTDLPPAFRATSERFLGRKLPPVEVVRRLEERWVRA